MTTTDETTTTPAVPVAAPISRPVYVLMQPIAGYGEDVWTSWRGSELRMKTRYLHGRECSYTLLWQGPDGAARRKEGGPLVSGPFGDLIPQDPYLSDSRRKPVVTVDVEPGTDLLLILVADPERADLAAAPQVLVKIVDDRPLDFPHLVALV